MQSLDDERLNRADRSRLLPEIRAMLDAADLTDAPSVDSMPPELARHTSEKSLADYWGKKDTIEAIETFLIPGGDGPIRVRLYRGAATARTIMFFHGGGWVVGSLDTHDGALRALALAARCNLLSVQYRKAPEALFPAAIADADAALDWLVQHGAAHGLDAATLIAAGDSAGGNIAAVAALRARDRALPLLGQMLIYPVTDLGMASASYMTFAEGFFLSRAVMQYYIGHYLGGAPANHPDASPLYVDDLGHLPPVLVVTADHDPLRDEGRAYAARLIGAGNNVTYEEWQGLIHGFMIMDGVTPAARRLIARMGVWANNLWATTP